MRSLRASQNLVWMGKKEVATCLDNFVNILIWAVFGECFPFKPMLKGYLLGLAFIERESSPLETVLGPSEHGKRAHSALFASTREPLRESLKG